MINQSSYSMEVLAPVICEFLACGRQVDVAAKGNSMRPLLYDVRDGIRLAPLNGRSLAAGDVIFYRRKKSGSYVIHRIVAVEDDGVYTLMGDNQTVAERGVTSNEILAVATAFIIKGRHVGADSPRYRRYARFWTKSHLVRKLYIKTAPLFFRIKKRLPFCKKL